MIPAAAAAAAAATVLACAAGAGAAATRAEPASASAASGASGASGDTAGAPSAAEQLLFLHPRLAAIREPRTLAYDYVAEGGPAPRVADRATLALVARKDGRCCGTHVDFLSGANTVNLPDLDDPQGNPVLMYFLESEVRLLERTTHGQSSHFRRVIRQALASDATVRDTTVRWGDRDVPAQEVRVAPFLNDPYRARFEHEAKTEYTFVFSDAVPGGIVRLAAAVPAEGDAHGARRTLAIADPQPAIPVAPAAK
jgi:hypothetical protein